MMRKIGYGSLLVFCACLAPSIPVACAGTSAEYVDYKHPIGLEFKHPKTWTVFESMLGLQAAPPDPATGPSGPAEVYIFSIVGADPTVASLSDPKAAQLLNGLVSQLLPFLSPGGESRAVGGGRVFSWNGMSPEGINVDCHVYGLLADGYFISLTALGEVQAVKRREAEVVNVFKTVRLGEPQADPQHAGTWYSSSYSSSGSYGDRVNTSTQHTMTFLPNGRLASSARTGVHGWAKGEAGGPEHTSITGATDASMEEGRWALDNNNLYILWKDGGVVKWSVYVQGSPGRREMMLTPAGGGDGVFWTEYPDF